MALNTNQRSAILTILKDAQEMSLATLRRDGYPQNTVVSFVNDGLTIYFCCSNISQKMKNISRNSKVSATITPPHSTWNDITGLSMAARASVVSKPEEIEFVQSLMWRKFAQIRQSGEFESWTLAFVRIAPKIVSIIDYSTAFGHSELASVGNGDLKSTSSFPRKSIYSHAHHG